MSLLRIHNGRVIDPSQNFDRVTDLWIEGERVLAVGDRPDLVADASIGILTFLGEITNLLRL